LRVAVLSDWTVRGRSLWLGKKDVPKL